VATAVYLPSRCSVVFCAIQMTHYEAEKSFMKEEWKWTMMMMQPDHITEEMYHEALKQVREKRDNPALSRLRLERFREGLCMQIMHIGPYAEEPRTIDRMMAFAKENDYALRGKHHEIYLGDPRRAKPERLRTILRHPIEKTASDDKEDT